MAELKVVLLKFNLPCGGTRSYFLGLAPVCKVFVISPNDDGLIRRSGAEQVRPVSKGTDDGEEFPVMNLVVHFCRCQGFGIIADSAQLLRHGRVPLPEDCS
jgi:hypothetical protein